MSGRFITVEGSEGVGKTTHLPFIEQRLRDAGHIVRVTREPGGTVLAEQLRETLLHASESVPDEAELLLMFAARCVHLANLIRPALARGEWVLCDRFTDATRAYQGGGRGQSEERIETLAAWVHGDLEPDLTLLLDAPPQVTRERLQARRGVSDRFERQDEAFFERVRARYRELARRWPERIRVVDASGSLDDVRARIGGVLDDFLAQAGR